MSSNDNEYEEFDSVKGILGGAAAVGVVAVGIACYQQVIIEDQQEIIQEQHEKITDLKIENTFCKDNIDDAKQVLE